MLCRAVASAALCPHGCAEAHSAPPERVGRAHAYGARLVSNRIVVVISLLGKCYLTLGMRPLNASLSSFRRSAPTRSAGAGESSERVRATAAIGRNSCLEGTLSRMYAAPRSTDGQILSSSPFSAPWRRGSLQVARAGDLSDESIPPYSKLSVPVYSLSSVPGKSTESGTFWGLSPPPAGRSRSLRVSPRNTMTCVMKSMYHAFYPDD